MDRQNKLSTSFHGFIHKELDNHCSIHVYNVHGMKFFPKDWFYEYSFLQSRGSIWILTMQSQSTRNKNLHI